MGDLAIDSDAEELRVTSISCGSSHSLALLSESVHPNVQKMRFFVRFLLSSSSWPLSAVQT